MHLQNTGILVTGGAGVLGSALCEALVHEGARVAALDNDSQRLGALKERLPQVATVQCDCADEHDVTRGVAMARTECGRIGSLILAGGITLTRPLLTPLDRQNPVHPLADWHAVMHSHLTAAFLTGRTVAKWMSHDNNHGVIIGIGSIAAHGHAGQSAYSAAKAGLRSLLSTWAKELAPLNIRTACIEPGLIDSPTTRATTHPEAIERLREQIPLGRLGEIDHIIQAVRFVLHNDYCTDCVIPVDGGLKI